MLFKRFETGNYPQSSISIRLRARILRRRVGQLEQNELLLKHDERLTTLEENDREQDRQIRELQQNYQKLESTIVQENRETRMIFQSTMDKQWDLIKTRDIAKENAHQRDHELQKTKLERRTELLIKLLGAGGLIYLCAQSILDVFVK